MKGIFSSLLFVLLASPGAVLADKWNYEAEVYVLAVTIEGDAGIGRAAGVDVDMNFDDILDVLNASAMVHFEAYKESGWGVALDYSFMDLRDDLSGPRGGVADAKIRQGVLQADVFYRSHLAKGTIDYIAGVRWWDNDLDVELDIAALPGSIEANVDEDWVDLFFGARWMTPVSESWSYILRGDIGGFGLESDFTSSVQTGFNYKLSDTFVLNMQYKVTWVDYETGSKGDKGYYAYDTVSHGPLVGLSYRF